MENRFKNNPFSNQQITAGWKTIQNADRITLLTHTRPDGDGISACTALDAVLREQNKKVECIYPDKPELQIKRKPKAVLINKHTQIPDLIIVCDTATYKQLYYPKEFEKIPLVNIDHHISNNISGLYNFINHQASSACEILTELMTAWNQTSITPYVAQALLCGILYDSQVFRTNAVSAKTLHIAANLMNQGADLFQLKNELLCNKNPQIIKLWAEVLHATTVITFKRVAWTFMTQKQLKKHNLTLTALVGFSNFLAEITDIDVTILLYETKDQKTKASLRSKERDINKIASYFGGGGHKNAAGIVSDLPIDQLANKIIQLL